MRTFNLQRDDDETGISGTGVVAQGVEFDDGTVAMRWLTETASFGLYDNIEELVIIHGHGGRTYPVFTNPDLEPADGGLIKAKNNTINDLKKKLDEAWENRNGWFEAWEELKEKYDERFESGESDDSGN